MPGVGLRVVGGDEGDPSGSGNSQAVTRASTANPTCIVRLLVNGTYGAVTKTRAILVL
jgi:hypothetical protein